VSVPFPRGDGHLSRTDGYAPIRDYAAIGDGRAVALVALDGSIDWLALPTLVSSPAFAAILDAERGGSFVLAPEGGFDSERRYLPDTNVLETTFRTADGVARVTDAITRRVGGPLPWVELVRRVEGLSGNVRLRFSVEPRFPFGGGDGVNLRLLSFGDVDGDERAGSIALRDGDTALLALVGVEHGPVPRPERDNLEDRLGETIEAWKSWIRDHAYEGQWHDAVTRSALALKLLTYEPTGAIVAALTTSLPEAAGGDANWDYRFSWVRDSAYSLDALLALGRREDAHASFTWLLDRIATTAPEIRPLYGLEGGPPLSEETLDLDGYRGARPVRCGNGAEGQTQLGVYGDLLDTAWRYVDEGNDLDEWSRTLIVRVLGYLRSHWRDPDSGFWEIRGDPRHYTHSKLSAQVAFDRALRLAERGQLPADDAPAWVREHDELGSFVEARCWSRELGAFRFYADVDRLDTTTLLAYRRSLPQRADDQLASTIDAVREGLSAGGPLLYRHSDAIGREGAFVACTFWLVDALTRAGRVDDAAETMEGMLALANDVGLYSEEIDPSSGDFLGNFPQGLSHLALTQAAVAVAEASSRRSSARAHASGGRRSR
jgi:GH15 family glucan-1,4-alpha-glucosidase